MRKLTAAIIALAVSGVSCTLKSKTEPANTVHIPVIVKIKGLDPVYADDVYSALQVGHAYEGLLQYHYLKRPYVLVPNLAEAMPEVSPDGKTLTFHLKKGILFQDDPCFKATESKGREMTADDVVYSLKRLADPKVLASGWWILDGKVAGINEWHDAAAKAGAADYAKPIMGLQAPDRYTVRITLVQRSTQFLYALAMPFAFVVPHEAVEFYGKEFGNHAVGTGPFRLSEYDPNAKVVWDRNPTYRQETYPSEGEPGDQAAGLLADAGKTLPLTDRIVEHILIEGQPRWLSFMSGKLDYIVIPKDNFQQAITPMKEVSPELKQKGISLHKAQELYTSHTTFNMVDPLIGKNKYLRQAISLAYDEGPFIDLFFNGRGIPAQGPIPPGLHGYDPAFQNPYRQFNLSRAKELLAKAGYPGGQGLPALEYNAPASTVDRQGTEYMQKMMGAIGVTLKVNAYSWPEFLNAMKQRKGQIWDFAWSADYPDAENFLQLFYSKNVSPGPNDANYANPEFDRLYEQSLALPDGPERTELYQKMVRIVVEDCPWIFNMHRVKYALTQARMKNFKIHDFDMGQEKYYRVDTPPQRK